MRGPAHACGGAGGFARTAVLRLRSPWAVALGVVRAGEGWDFGEMGWQEFRKWNGVGVGSISGGGVLPAHGHNVEEVDFVKNVVLGIGLKMVPDGQEIP